MDEDSIATLGEKCIGLDFEAQPVGFVDEVTTGMWNVGRMGAGESDSKFWV